MPKRKITNKTNKINSLSILQNRIKGESSTKRYAPVQSLNQERTLEL
jgi:hypothetical protein